MSLLKKREAEIQISKDEIVEEEEIEKERESNSSIETWNKATEEILTERRFVSKE